MRQQRLRRGSVLLLIAACTVSNDDGDPFATGQPTAATLGSSATTMEEETDDESGESGSSTSDGGSSPGTSSSEGGANTTLPVGSSSSGAVDPSAGQPADGMYSMCTSSGDCGNLPVFCITDADATDGFCSVIGCTNAAADCDPAPGGTATPACVGPFDIDGSDEMGCALDCAGGLVCPTGMVCMSFTDIGMICM